MKNRLTPEMLETFLQEIEEKKKIIPRIELEDNGLYKLFYAHNKFILCNSEFLEKLNIKILESLKPDDRLSKENIQQ